MALRSAASRDQTSWRDLLPAPCQYIASTESTATDLLTQNYMRIGTGSCSYVVQQLRCALPPITQTPAHL